MQIYTGFLGFWEKRIEIPLYKSKRVNNTFTLLRVSGMNP
jgi:hypothetical protein